MASQPFAFLLDLEGGGDGGHDPFEARIAAQIIPLWTKLEMAEVRAGRLRSRLRRLPSAPLMADARRGYEGNLLFVGQFAKPRND